MEVIVVELDERKKQILGAIIESYIETAEPVGSRTISKSHNLDLSPATIRNEMADLEDMGLLEQPHTSAGRIPSHLGYRMYVDRLMKRYELTANEISKMNTLMQHKVAELNSIVKEMSNIYSRLTNYTVIGASQEVNRGFIKHFHLVPIDDTSAMLMLMTDTNIVKNKKLSFDIPIDAYVANTISNILNEKLAGIPQNKIDIDLILEVQNETPEYQSVIMQILKFANECMNIEENSEVFLGGATNLLNYPEYSNVNRAKALLEFLDDKANLHRTVALREGQKVKIIIGSENEALELQDCSVVLSSYTVGDKVVGTIGLIGPTRMDYSRAASNLEFFTQQLNKLVQKNIMEDKL